LKRRGYNDKVIESGFSKASEINRNDLLEYKGKKGLQLAEWDTLKTVLRMATTG
jgi:hypothetical protein